MSGPALLEPVSARRPPLKTAMTGDEALRAILLECLAQVTANAPVVAKTANGEGLHQLRVGLRRLRTALRLTDEAALDALDGRAKELVASVGPARDLDVFTSALLRPALIELGARRGFDILSERAEHWRQAAWQRAVAAITDTSFLRFTDDVAAAAAALHWEEAETIGVMAPTLLDRALKRAKKRGRRFQSLAAPARHRLRIALKKLRYGAEFFAPLYPQKAVKAWLTPLKDLQDRLGDLNDVAAVQGVIGRLLLQEAQSAAAQADLSHAAGLLQSFHQARAEDVGEKAAKEWKTFRDSDGFWS